VSLIFGSVVFFQCKKKTHLTITKDDPVKIALIVVVPLSVCLFPEHRNITNINTTQTASATIWSS